MREALNSAPVTVYEQSATVVNLFGFTGILLLVAAALATLFYLMRSPLHSRGKLWNWLILGLITGVFMSFAWLMARAGGSNYTYGTSGVPSEIVLVLMGADNGGSAWIPIALVCLIPGAFIASRRAGTFWLRGETGRRYLELSAGGLLMGIGAGIAGGCNLGHSLVGVPLLSLGSILTTVAMALGVFFAAAIAKRLAKDPVPRYLAPGD